MNDAAEAKHQAQCLEQLSWNDEDGDAWLTPDCEPKGFGSDSIALALAAAGAEIDRLQRELASAIATERKACVEAARRARYDCGLPGCWDEHDTTADCAVALIFARNTP